MLFSNINIAVYIICTSCFDISVPVESDSDCFEKITYIFKFFEIVIFQYALLLPASTKVFSFVLRGPGTWPFNS